MQDSTHRNPASENGGEGRSPRSARRNAIPQEARLKISTSGTPAERSPMAEALSQSATAPSPSGACFQRLDEARSRKSIPRSVSFLFGRVKSVSGKRDASFTVPGARGPSAGRRAALFAEFQFLRADRCGAALETRFQDACRAAAPAKRARGFQFQEWAIRDRFGRATSRARISQPRQGRHFPRTGTLNRMTPQRQEAPRPEKPESRFSKRAGPTAQKCSVTAERACQLPRMELHPDEPQMLRFPRPSRFETNKKFLYGPRSRENRAPLPQKKAAHCAALP